MKRHQLLLAAMLASASVVNAARFDAPPASARPQVDREYLLAHIRVAAADRLIEKDDEIAAYLAAQFNTIVLYDVDNGLLKSEERIAFETSFARAHHLHILLGKPTEVPVSASAARGRRPLALASAFEVADDDVRDRLALWDRYGHDEILGVFFVHDDVFLLHTTVERQRHLYALAHETVPDWAVFAIIGELGFVASSDDVAQYFDAAAFDHLLILMYPLNTGYLTGTRLNSATAADPDEDMRRYVQRYVARMGEKFVARLRPGQLAILVVQAFAYESDAIGQVPRPADIMIQTAMGGDVLRTVPGQERNRSMAYFLWDGSRAGISGLWQRQDWMATAEEANRLQALRGGEVDLNP